MATAADADTTTAMLNRDLTKIQTWSVKWKMKFNPGKSEDIIFSTKRTFNLVPPVTVVGSVIKRVDIHKHLGVYLAFDLNWTKQIHEVCMKANRKLAVLRTVNGLKRGTLDVLYKLTVRSVIDYCLPVYFGTLNQSDIFRLEQIQYRAAKFVTGALHYSSKEKLNVELGWESIADRYNILGLSLFHKIHIGETRPLVKKCMPSINPQIYDNTRNCRVYMKSPFTSVKMSRSFFPHFTQNWTNLDKSIQTSFSLQDFKSKIKNKFKPVRKKHFNKGSKIGNTLLTRLRLGRSLLREHGYTIGLSDTTVCDCHHPRESTMHFLIDCFLYTSERLTLFEEVSCLLPKFNEFGKNKKVDILLNGFHPDNPDWLQLNINLQIKVQKYILKTKRFHNPSETE